MSLAIESPLQKNNFISNEAVAYALNIQRGILPKKRHLKKISPDFGIIWKPHSVLSGDFYWVSEKNNEFYVCVGDCTGHGIAASLLTVMGINLLNYIVLGKDFSKLGDYLNELDKKWIETFQAEEESGNFNNDWLELSLIKINKKQQTVEFSGAKSKIIIKRKNELLQFRGDNFPIGGWQIEDERNFTSTVIHYENGDEIFLFTDGIVDQFGGYNDKRFGIKQLKSILKLDLNSVNEKIQFLDETLSEWQNDNIQTDDMTILGIKL
ncbi:MAG TPA: hypothetical protein DIU39_09345 [Flavobacteriales bacterium]|nr:hypothetical protein [Flavobacteriales bacterium]|tara:strand:+ start:63861 stop:64658 length:798 start_codon:yes stop_codon:yes gene_type:complete